MSLQARIIADMKEAMRAKDQPRLEAVRLLRAAIQRREVDERIELDDDGVLAIVQKMIKQGRDAIEQFERGKRSDLVDSETKTLKVLEVYLPKQLDESEIQQLLDQAMGETGADSQRDMGKVMGWIKPRVQGRADMGALSGTIKQKLSA